MCALESELRNRTECRRSNRHWSMQLVEPQHRGPQHHPRSTVSGWTRTQVCHPDRSAPNGKACHYHASQATPWQPSTQTTSEPGVLARQSPGPPSHLAASPVCTRGPGIWLFAHRSGLRAILGQQQEEQCTVPSGEKSQVSWEARSWAKQALPCAPASRPRAVLPSGGSSAVTFLHVLGRRGGGALLAPSGKLHSLPERKQVRVWA